MSLVTEGTSTSTRPVELSRQPRFERPIRLLGTTITCIDIVWFVLILIILWPILKMNLYQ